MIERFQSSRAIDDTQRGEPANANNKRWMREAQPWAAIFSLCMSIVAGNALAVVKQAIRSRHGEAEAVELRKGNRQVAAVQEHRDLFAVDLVILRLASVAGAAHQ